MALYEDTKIGIDATRPVNGDKIASDMVNYPAYYPTEKIDLKDYLN